jgi:hypothetical protein
MRRGHGGLQGRVGGEGGRRGQAQGGGQQQNLATVGHVVGLFRVRCGDLNHGSPAIKRLATGVQFNPLKSKTCIPTIYSKALDTRAFRTTGDADFGSPTVRTSTRPCLKRRM